MHFFFLALVLHSGQISLFTGHVMAIKKFWRSQSAEVLSFFFVFSVKSANLENLSSCVGKYVICLRLVILWMNFRALGEKATIILGCVCSLTDASPSLTMIYI